MEMFVSVVLFAAVLYGIYRYVYLPSKDRKGSSGSVPKKPVPRPRDDE